LRLLLFRAGLEENRTQRPQALFRQMITEAFAPAPVAPAHGSGPQLRPGGSSPRLRPAAPARPFR